MSEATATEAEQEHGQRVAFLTEAAETLENLHLAAVHQTRTTRCHPGTADDLGDLGATFDGREDLGVETVDFFP